GECTLAHWRDAGARDLDRTQEPSTRAYLATDSDESKDFAQCLTRNRHPSALQWVGGVEFSRQTMHELQTRILTPDLRYITTLIYPSEGYSRYTRSGFFQTTYQFNNTAATLGGRYDEFSDFSSHFSPRFTLSHFFTSADTLKLMLGNAFLSPTAFQRFGSGLTILAAPTLKAEQMNTYELAWLHNTNKQSIAITAFANAWKDAIVLGPAGGPDKFKVQYANEENSRSHGVELEWQQDWSAVKSHLSYTRSQAKNQRSGLDYTGFPKNILTLNLGYELSGLPVSIGLQSVFANQFDLREAIASDPNPPSSPSYIRFDFHANWVIDKNLSLFADTRNLANRTNPVASVFNQEFGLADESATVLIGANLLW
ncbi:MAG TPA: TonB-dependent receptor, partial [Pseudomonadales bacterium]|nr:TonB-dependent receptor [Pseudomonadales bacterium]